MRKVPLTLEQWITVGHDLQVAVEVLGRISVTICPAVSSVKIADRLNRFGRTGPLGKIRSTLENEAIRQHPDDADAIMRAFYGDSRENPRLAKLGPPPTP